MSKSSQAHRSLDGFLLIRRIQILRSRAAWSTRICWMARSEVGTPVYYAVDITVDNFVDNVPLVTRACRPDDPTRGTPSPPICQGPPASSVMFHVKLRKKKSLERLHCHDWPDQADFSVLCGPKSHGSCRGRKLVSVCCSFRCSALKRSTAWEPSCD